MKREILIAYSLFYDGEYTLIDKAVNTNKQITPVNVANAITIFDDEYPKELLSLKYPPYVLYYKGNLDLLKENKIAVVGSRKPCDYALKATKALVRANKDKVIISGLAKGIDACAHQNAYRTIGILGCGIDYIYPYCNKQLIEDVSRNGLILSEYPFMSKPLAFHFPFRNRIISALSNKVYIMQSNSASGTMTTVNEALELGKTIKVLPYDIFNEYGINNNRLIYEGAEPVLLEEIAF